MKVNIGFVILSIVIILAMILLARGAEKLADRRNGNEKQKKMQHTRRMVIIAMLAAVAVVLMVFEIPLPFLPPFYKIGISELPVIIGAFTLGPAAGVVIEFLKVLLNLFIDGSDTAFVGEFANFLMGCFFVVPASMVYYFRKNRKNALLGLVLGSAVCVTGACLLNAFVLLPAYSQAFHMDLAALISMGSDKNGAIHNMVTFILLATAPQNLIKCSAVSVLTMLIYKPTSRILKGEQ